jgi:hypothetical protein
MLSPNVTTEPIQAAAINIIANIPILWFFVMLLIIVELYN